MGSSIWLCVHNKPADTCDQCDEEDCAINGEREVFQCEHPIQDQDGVCFDCGSYIDEDPIEHR